MDTRERLRQRALSAPKLEKIEPMADEDLHRRLIGKRIVSVNGVASHDAFGWLLVGAELTLDDGSVLEVSRDPDCPALEILQGRDGPR